MSGRPLSNASDLTTPIACSLSANDLAEREQTWLAVIDRALREKRPIADGVRLEFEPDHELLHQLATLVHAERECCPWAAWTLIDAQDVAAIEVTASSDEGRRAARALFGVE